MRVVIGGISHETSTFTPVKTTIQSYEERCLLRGEAIIQRFQNTNTPMGGFIDGATKHNFELIPTLLAEAHTSGPTPRPIFDALLDELLQGIQEAGQIDGILLELHGSMVVGDLDSPDGIDDVEGHILSSIRSIIGKDVPIIAQLDIHSNVSQKMVDMADVLIGRETYPEIDMAERGRECTDVLVRIHQKGLHPTMALYQIPMVWGMNQVTAHEPMKTAIEKLHQIEQDAKVLCGSISVCYFLADVPDMGSSVFIVTNNDLSLAHQYAKSLGDWIFERRADWHYLLPSTSEALDIAEKNGKFPIVIADSRDNTGGGAPGDSTGMLRTFIDKGLENACVLYIVDPDAITECHQAGVGATLTIDIGGKSSPLQGQPIQMTVEVVGISDGHFRYDGPMYAGLEGRMGKSAYIRQGGIHVVLVSVGEQPFDTAFSRTLGLDPKQMRYIGVKSTAHFRAGFESWAGAIHLVSEPSVHDLGNLPFKRLKRRVYPFDLI